MIEEVAPADLARFRELYEEAATAGETGDEFLDALLITSGPKFGDMLRMLSVPHWFESEILKALLAEGPGSETDAIAEIEEFSFVRPHRNGLSFHDVVRERLRAALIKNAPEDFFAASGRMADFFSSLAEGDGEESIRWEAIYHQVAVDEDSGLPAFDKLFKRNRIARRFSACHALSEMLAEQREAITPDQRPWVDYYRGLINYDSHNWRASQEIFDAFELRNLPSELASRVAIHKGLTAEAQDEWARARRVYTGALKYLPAVTAENAGIAARLHQRLAQTNLEMGNLKNAMRYVQQSLDLNSKYEDAFGSALNFRTIGRINAILRKAPAAVSAFEKCLRELEKAGREFSKAIVYADLAELATDQREFEVAEKHYERAIDLRTKGGDNFGLAVLYMDLGNVKFLTKDYDSALRHFDRSISLFERFDDRRRMAKALYNKGEAFLKIDAVGAAEASLQEAIELLEQEGAPVAGYRKMLKRIQRQEMGLFQKALRVLGLVVVLILLYFLLILSFEL